MHPDSPVCSAQWLLPGEVLERGLFRSIETAVADDHGRSGRCSLHPFLSAGRPFVALLLPVLDTISHVDTSSFVDGDPVSDGPVMLRFDVAWQPLLRTERFLRSVARDGFVAPA